VPLAALLLRRSSFAAESDPKFTVLFPDEGIVTKGWTVRTWSNIKDAPELQTLWEVRDGLLYGGKSPARKWVGTLGCSASAEYGDLHLEGGFQICDGGATGNGGIALRTP